LSGLLLLVAAAGLLVVGSELFAEYATAAGRRLGVSALAVGLVLAGAEPEELVTALIASLRDRPGLAVGDALGANITMLTLVVGLAALVRPVPFGHRVRRYAVAASAAGVAAAVALLGGLNRAEGGLLLAGYAALIAAIWRVERTPPLIGEAAELAEHDHDDHRPGPALLLVLAGIALMTVGGRLAIAGAERLVAALDQTDTAIGLTLVALATTAELLALVAAAARRRLDHLAVAAVLGSAAYNATVTLGAAALARPLTAQNITTAAWLAAGLPLGLIAVSRRDHIPRVAGLALLTLYAGYLAVALT
jgi:cation:H+ antiporter